MNTILTIRKRLAQGYTHVYYPHEAGADFEKQITDESWCAKSINEAIENICSERGVALIDYDMIGHSCFVWDLQEELDDRTSVCTRDCEAGNIIEFFTTVGEANAAIREYEKTDRDEGTYSPDFYEVAVRKEGVYVRHDG